MDDTTNPDLDYINDSLVFSTKWTVRKAKENGINVDNITNHILELFRNPKYKRKYGDYTTNKICKALSASAVLKRYHKFVVSHRAPRKELLLTVKIILRHLLPWLGSIYTFDQEMTNGLLRVAERYSDGTVLPTAAQKKALIYHLSMARKAETQGSIFIGDITMNTIDYVLQIAIVRASYMIADLKIVLNALGISLDNLSNEQVGDLINECRYGSAAKTAQTICTGLDGVRLSNPVNVFIFTEGLTELYGRDIVDFNLALMIASSKTSRIDVAIINNGSCSLTRRYGGEAKHISQQLSLKTLSGDLVNYLFSRIRISPLSSHDLINKLSPQRDNIVIYYDNRNATDYSHKISSIMELMSGSRVLNPTHNRVMTYNSVAGLTKALKEAAWEQSREP